MAGMPAPEQVRASGGGTASPLWRQILAYVLRAELATVSTTEGAAFGAGVLGAVGAGWFGSVEAATVRHSRRNAPSLQSSGAMSAMVSVKSQRWPWKSCTLYWRSP